MDGTQKRTEDPGGYGLMA